LGGVINMLGRPHPEEIESWYHEQSWPQIAQRPFVWGSFVWNMFDFSSDLRDEGDSVDINNKGLVSYDRKTKKDAFFYYKAQWSPDPVVHINGSRYVERPYAITDVRIYSNASSVRLSHNGLDLGEVDCRQGVCVWPNVVLRPGVNNLSASGIFSGRTVTDSVQWTAPDPMKGLVINSGDLVGHRGTDGRLIGSDNFFSGGQARLLNGFSGGGFVATNRKRKSIVGAGDPSLYEGYREGSFSYDIPMPNGEWQVTVHSFESIERLIDQRTFSVTANDREAVKAWSPGKSAGGTFRAAEVTFKVRVNDGRLRLRFDPVGGAAVVAAIAVTP
jgi:beta-galactosidase